MTISIIIETRLDGAPTDPLQWLKSTKNVGDIIHQFYREVVGVDYIREGKNSSGVWSFKGKTNDDQVRTAEQLRDLISSNDARFKADGINSVLILADKTWFKVIISAESGNASKLNVSLKVPKKWDGKHSSAKASSTPPEVADAPKASSGSSSSVGMWQEGMIIIRAIDGVSENVTQDFLRLNSGGSDLMKYLRTGEGRGQWKFARNGDAQLEVLRKVKHVMDPEEYKKYLWRNYIGVSLSNKLKEGKLAVENWSIKIVEAEPDYYHYIFRFEIPGYKSKQGFQGLRV